MAVHVAGVALSRCGGCGYNTLQPTDEQIKAAWAEVVNQYQRRADLIPNLVEHGQGLSPQQEKDVLTQVTEARAKVGTIQATPETDQRSGGVRRSSRRRRAS